MTITQVSAVGRGFHLAIEAQEPPPHTQLTNSGHAGSPSSKPPPATRGPRLLTTLDPNSADGNAGQTVQDQLDTLAQRGASLKANLAIYGGQPQPMDVLLANLSEQDLISFYDHAKLSANQARRKAEEELEEVKTVSVFPNRELIP